MLLFNLFTTKTKVCPCGKRHDWGASRSMNFFAPTPIKADATPMGCLLHLKINPPLKMNLPVVEI